MRSFFVYQIFFNTVNSGLGFHTEQAMESVHADFKRTLEKYKVTKNHPDYADKLRRALSEYNTLHC